MQRYTAYATKNSLNNNNPTKGSNFLKADSCRPGPEICSLLRKINFRYRMYKSALVQIILSQKANLHHHVLFFLTINFNLILPTTSRSRRCALRFTLSS